MGTLVEVGKRLIIKKIKYGFFLKLSLLLVEIVGIDNHSVQDRNARGIPPPPPPPRKKSCWDYVVSLQSNPRDVIEFTCIFFAHE